MEDGVQGLGGSGPPLRTHRLEFAAIPVPGLNCPSVILQFDGWTLLVFYMALIVFYMEDGALALGGSGTPLRTHRREFRAIPVPGLNCPSVILKFDGWTLLVFYMALIVF